MKKLLKWVLIFLTVIFGPISLLFFVSGFFVLAVAFILGCYGCAIGVSLIRKTEKFDKTLDKHLKIW